MKPPAYTPVAMDDEVNSEKSMDERASGFLFSYFERRLNHLVIALLILSLLFASMSAILAAKLISLSREIHSSDMGYFTDLASARKTVELRDTQFTGGLKYNDKNELYREIEPYQPQYVGPPSSEIDAAWDELLAPLGMVLNDEEAGEAKGTTYQEPDGRWLMTLDVFHSLHCVNLVRQALDPKYYLIAPNNAHAHRLHTDHCLDYLRQALQCSADLTPLTYLWSESRHSRYPIFGATHTCRNFDTIHTWATERLGNYSL